LLSGIGVNSSEEGLDKLMAIWSAYHEQDHDIKRYLPGWLKDYHVYYALSHSFTDFINKYKLQAYYSDLLLFESDAENSLDLWGSVSNYKVDKSKFYNSDDGTLLKDCFYAVLNGIRTFCVSRNTRIEDLFVYEVSKKLTWYPFRQALFYSWLRQPDRQVEIPGPEAYYCRNNRWTTDIAIHHSGRAVLVGYIIKKTEACLRQTIKYKYKITVDPDVVNRSFQKLKALRITLTDLDQVIENSVTAFYRDINRTVVTVDHGSLARIREEASGTQDMLIVPEVEPVSSSPSITPTLVSTLQESQMDLKSETDNWSILKNELSTIELEALKILLADVSETGIKAFANKNGIMIEVLADGINEKAADHIGDNLLDEDMIIYEDYAEKIAELVR
ncbi:MAG: TerB N-terminal domain-containing protein, partial [Defluviitaleaceae bacterium]|nr:TerB N-terminal domain-containing protein [Defluviitaleaceae bacterium]